MMLEAGEKGQTDSDEDVTTYLDVIEDDTITEVAMKVIGEWDPLRHTKSIKPVEIENKYELLYESDDDDDDDESPTEIDATSIDEHDSTTKLHKRRRFNQRRRRRRRLQFRYDHDEDFEDTLENEEAMNCTAIALPEEELEGSPGGCRGWHPAPEHCGDLLRHDTRRTNINDHYYYHCNDVGSSVFTYNDNNHNTIGSSAGLCTHYCNCSSKFACPTTCFHRPSSPGRCHLSLSSGLSAGTDPNSSERVTAHECRLCGVEGREVMSLAEATPTAQLFECPRPLCSIAESTCFLQGQDVFRARLAHPSNGTRPSPIEGRGSQAHVRALDQKDIASRSW